MDKVELHIWYSMKICLHRSINARSMKKKQRLSNNNSKASPNKKSKPSLVGKKLMEIGLAVTLLNDLREKKSQSTKLENGITNLREQVIFCIPFPRQENTTTFF